VTNAIESCHTQPKKNMHIYIFTQRCRYRQQHVMYKCVKSLMACSFVCDVIHSCVRRLVHVWHDSFIYDMFRTACYVWMSHVTYGWVLLYHIRRSHAKETLGAAGTGCGMSRINESCHIWTRHLTHEWVTSHTNEQHHVMSRHVTSRHVTLRANESRHIRIATSHVIEFCFIWLSRVRYGSGVSHINESCHI